MRALACVVTGVRAFTHLLSVATRVVPHMLRACVQLMILVLPDAVQVRHDSRYDDHIPVTVHVNYHPDKHPRMLAIVKRYVDGDTKALTPFPSGSE